MSVSLQQTISHRGFGPGRGPDVGRLLGRWLAAAYRRRQQRRALAQLDDRLLRDIGVDRQDALLEAAKPFWR